MSTTTLPFIELKETVSEREQTFDRWRNTIGLFLGPLVALAMYSVDMPSLSPKAHVLAAILSWTVVWWVCEPIPLAMTALLSSVLCVVFGVGEARAVFAPYADPIIYLFLGSFMLAEAMAIHGLDKRFAYGIMALKFVGNSAGRILLAFGFICAFLSMWISNTAATAMMFPIALGIVYALADIRAKQTGRKVDPLKLRFGTGMMLMAAYAASAGGIGTPVGSPPNLIGIAMIEEFCGVKIAFFQWMSFADSAPVPSLCAPVSADVLPPQARSRAHRGRHRIRARGARQAGPLDAGQKNALFCFLVTVTLWLIPGILSVVYGGAAPVTKAYSKLMPEGVAAITGALLLFLLPVDWKKREFTVSWNQATKIDWGTLLLFGGGITLGTMMFDTKLAEVIGSGLLTMSGATSVWGITFGAIYIAMLVSETSSNTASANMVIPVMIALAQAAGVNPLPPAIGATLGASLGFMLPVSTPPNAIVYGSGMVPITSMIRAGIFFDLLGGLVIWAGLYVLLPLVGLG